MNGDGNEAVLVKRSWAQAVDKVVDGANAAIARGANPDQQFALSRFYDMRPALLQSAWAQNSAGVYQATAAFIVADTGTADTSFIFPIYALPGTTPKGTAGSTRFFVVWRGRWEALSTVEATDLQPVRLASAWSLSDGVYRASCNPITSTGSVDTTTSFYVYAPAYTKTPPGVSGVYRFWAVWRNDRWESLQDTEDQLFQPFRLQTAWTKSSGIYRCTAKKITSDAGAVSSGNFTVYAPTFTNTPPGEVGVYKFWAVWRNGRWESLQNVETLDYKCVQLKTAWSFTNSVWTATANPITSAGAADTSTTLTIYAPQFVSTQTPPGVANSSRFWVVWNNNRWESLQGTDVAEEGMTLSPFILDTSWTLGQDGVYYADANPIDASGVVDEETTVQVFAPAAMGVPYGTNQQWRFWAVWRNDRWETIQPNFPEVSAGAVVEPFALQSNWTQVSGSTYKATAKKIIADSGTLDTEVVDVYSPAGVAGSPPAGLSGGDSSGRGLGNWKCWCVWKNDRWETLQTRLPQETNYIGGAGIDVGSSSSSLGGRPITNTGTLGVAIVGGSYESSGETFLLSGSHFKWLVDSGSGRYVAWVKTTRVSVVTDIVNGVPTKKTVEVVGEL